MTQKHESYEKQYAVGLVLGSLCYLLLYIPLWLKEPGLDHGFGGRVILAGFCAAVVFNVKRDAVRARLAWIYTTACLLLIAHIWQQTLSHGISGLRPYINLMFLAAMFAPVNRSKPLFLIAAANIVAHTHLLMHAEAVFQREVYISGIYTFIIFSFATGLSRVRAIEDLNLSYQTLTGMINAFPDLFVFLDTKGQVIEIYGDKSLLNANQGDELVEQLNVKKSFLAARETRGLENFEISYNQKDLQGRMLVVSKERVLMLLLDITEQRNLQKLEKERQAQVANLSHLSSLGTLASGISHELNNPLCIAQLSVRKLQIQKERNKMQDWDKGHADLSTSVKRLYTVLNELETFCHNKSVETAVPFTREALQDACAQWSEQHAFTIKVQAEFSHLMLPVATFKAVLYRLLDNAKDAALEQANPNVSVNLSGNANFWSLKVMDSGAGIPADIADRIWTPFFTTKAVGKGFGLGLSVIHGLLKSLGGTIAYRREQNQTVFECTVQKERHRVAA